MTSPFRRGALLILVGMLRLSALAEAQGTGGVIDGYVKDPDGRPTPGVQIIVNSPSLIQKDLSVFTNEEGYYRVPSLPPGR